MKGLLLTLLVCIVCSCVSSQYVSKNGRLLVIYSYYYAAPPLHPDEENLIFFSCSGVYFNDDRVEYVFLFVSDDPRRSEGAFRSTPLYDALPPDMYTATNVRILWVANGYYDLCTYTRVLLEPWFSKLSKSTSLYFFLNATVRGPFMPFYAKHIPWWEPFISLLDEHTSLVGPYLNCEVAPHIQTLAFMLDRIGLEVAKRTWFCPSSDVRRSEAARAAWIAQNEVGLSRNLIAAGRSFSTFLASHIGVKGERLKTDESCTLRNPTFYHNYFGAYPNPYEVIFFKCGGDVRRANAMPDHASSLLRLYSEAAARQWPYKNARDRFISAHVLTTAPCLGPLPDKNAVCLENFWVIRDDWHISEHVVIRTKTTVLGSMKLHRSATLRLVCNPDDPLIFVDGSVTLQGQLRVSLVSVGQRGSFVILRSKQKITGVGEVTVEGAEPFETSTTVECDGSCLVLSISGSSRLSYFGLLSPVAALLVGLMYWRKRARTPRERRYAMKSLDV